MPCWEGDVEPLHAVYAVALPRRRSRRSLRAGRHALREFLATAARRLRERGASCAPCAAPPRSLTNVNTPEELAAVGGRFEEPEP